MKFTLKCTPAEIVEKELQILFHPGFTVHQVEVLWDLEVSELQSIACDYGNQDQEKLIKKIVKNPAEFFEYYNEFYSVSEVA